MIAIFKMASYGQYEGLSILILKLPVLILFLSKGLNTPKYEREDCFINH